MSIVLFEELNIDEIFVYNEKVWTKVTNWSAELDSESEDVVCSFGEDFSNLIVKTGKIELTELDKKIEQVHKYISLLISKDSILMTMEMEFTSKNYLDFNKKNVDKLFKETIFDKEIEKDLENLEDSILSLDEDLDVFLETIEYYAINTFKRIYRRLRV